MDDDLKRRMHADDPMFQYFQDKSAEEEQAADLAQVRGVDVARFWSVAAVFGCHQSTSIEIILSASRRWQSSLA